MGSATASGAEVRTTREGVVGERACSGKWSALGKVLDAITGSVSLMDALIAAAGLDEPTNRGRGETPEAALKIRTGEDLACLASVHTLSIGLIALLYASARS